MITVTVPIDRAKLEEKRKELAGMGIPLNGDHTSVTTSRFNVSADLDYNGTSLTVKVTKKPWYLSSVVVESAIKNFLS